MPVLRGLPASEDPQQRGLAGAVGPDQADDVARRDDEIQPGEQGPVAVPGGEVLGDQRCAHAPAPCPFRVIKAFAAA